MRKKYLSALLFGALLVTSAGTFTSCKDYDDEINNLQEQIDKVVADLESLKTTVEGLGGYVTDVKIENGKLVVTANGSTVSYDLPAGTSSEVANIEIKNGHLYVNNEDKGSVGNTVTVNEDGELLIDGNASGLKVGTEVIIKDSSNGMYTISIDGQTIQLPMVTASVTVKAVDAGETTFEAFGGSAAINWNKAADDIDWKGPKGEVAKDQYLFGMISEVQVTVLPASYDLSQQELKLVNSKGEYAPVAVTATASDDVLVGGSRAAANVWNLAVAMDAEAEDGSFDDGESSAKLVKYALSVNGTVVTGYDYSIHVAGRAQSTAAAEANLDFDCEGNATASNTALSGVKVGKNEIIIGGTDAAKVYDAYLEIVDEDAAAEYGITVDGMTITASDKAKSVPGFKVMVHVLDVTGAEVESAAGGIELTLSFENATVDGEAIADQTYKLVNKDYVVVDLGNTFTSLSDADANKVGSNTGKIVWTSAKGSKTFGEVTGNGIQNIKYYKSAEIKAENEVLPTSAATIKNIRYATIPVGSFASDNEAGVNNLTITLKSGNDEVKKVTTAFTVEYPSFSDIFTANEKSGMWKDGEYTTRMAYKTNAYVPFGLETFYVADAENNPFGVDITDIEYSMTYVDNQGVEKTVNVDNLKDANSGNTSIISSNKLVANKFKVTATVTINSKVEVSKEFTLNLKTLFEGAELKYFTGESNTESDYALVESNGTIKSFVDKKDGLAIVFDGKKGGVTGSTAFTVGGYSVTLTKSDTDPSTASGATSINGSVALDTSVGSMGTLAVTASNISITDLNGDATGILKVTFKDVAGIKTTTSIKYKLK